METMSLQTMTRSIDADLARTTRVAHLKAILPTPTMLRPMMTTSISHRAIRSRVTIVIVTKMATTETSATILIKAAVTSATEKRKTETREKKIASEADTAANVKTMMTTVVNVTATVIVTVTVTATVIVTVKSVAIRAEADARIVATAATTGSKESRAETEIERTATEVEEKDCEV